jgi:hypothetical protein
MTPTDRDIPLLRQGPAARVLAVVHEAQATQAHSDADQVVRRPCRAPVRWAREGVRDVEGPCF